MQKVRINGHSGHAAYESVGGLVTPPKEGSIPVIWTKTAFLHQSQSLDVNELPAYDAWAHHQAGPCVRKSSCMW